MIYRWGKKTPVYIYIYTHTHTPKKTHTHTHTHHTHQDMSVSSSEVILASGEKKQDRKYMYNVILKPVHVMFIPHQLS